MRIPEIVRRAGARLIEVGTTNRTRAADFEAPLAEGRARVVLRVHPSNFTMTGFIEAPDPAELAGLAHEHGAIVVDDLGSGALLDTAAFGLAHEPMPAERLAAGADLVTFSGDKLVGGPQAGLVVGRADLIARMRRDPLARAMRPDKVTLAARRGDARAVPRRPRDDRDPGLADDRARRRDDAREPRGRPGGARSAVGSTVVESSELDASAADRCRARPCRRGGIALGGRLGGGLAGAALRRGDAGGHRPDRGRTRRRSTCGPSIARRRRRRRIGRAARRGHGA